jgi:hypothetical protein
MPTEIFCGFSLFYQANGGVVPIYMTHTFLVLHIHSTPTHIFP